MNTEYTYLGIETDNSTYAFYLNQDSEDGFKIM